MASKRDPEATKAALLQAAEDIFLKQGFGNTSLSQIAKKAGVTKSLIHHYFGSKSNLWSEVKHRRFSQYITRQLEMLSQMEPTADLLTDSIRFYFGFIMEHPEIVQIMVWMFLEEPIEEYVKPVRELSRLGVEKIKAAQEKGELRKDIDARFILFSFLGLAQGWVQGKGHFLYDFGDEDLPDDLDGAYLADMLKIFTKGVLPG